MEAFLNLLLSISVIVAVNASIPGVEVNDRVHRGLPEVGGAAFSEVADQVANPFDEQPDHFYAAALEESGISLKAESVDKRISQETLKNELTRCKAVAYKTLQALPSAHSTVLKNLTFTFQRDDRRGYGGSETILLRCIETGDAEMAAVMVHELGHLVDLGLIKGSGYGDVTEFYDGVVPIYSDDSSVDFYRISWKSSDVMKRSSSDLDFVSGYAKTDVFEDFAESYVFYVLHGSEFRELAEMNVALAQKYQFLKQNIFGGEEFYSDRAEIDYFNRPYDVTVLPYNYSQLIGSSLGLKKILAQDLTNR